MKKNTHWETIISVIVITIIIWIIMLAFTEIIKHDDRIGMEYKKNNYLYFLKKNTDKILTKLDLSSINEEEYFFLLQYENSIEILTWSLNKNYQYINYLSENINIESYNGIIYTRVCQKKWNNGICKISEWEIK